MSIAPTEAIMDNQAFTYSAPRGTSTFELTLIRKARFTTLPGVQTRKSSASCMAVRSYEQHLDTFLMTFFSVMPARVMLFDQRVRTLHDFGTSFSNYISFNPQSRLLLLGGFGNLAGKIDIYDRRSLTKISTIDASNTSHCEWSADGKFILTATLSPRLRVDNGIKIWYLLGQLLHVQECEELYQAS